VAEYRVRGEEVQIRITRNGALQTTITAVKSLVFETRQRIITENYLGESVARHDEIADEVGGTIVLHPEGREILDLQKLVWDRSQRRIANDEQIGLTFRVSFPRGAIRISVPDVKIDPIPLNVSSRDAYVDMTLTYKSNRYSINAA
jgi:hypothetical protein